MIPEPHLKVLSCRDGATVHARVLGPVNGATAPVIQERLDGLLVPVCRGLVLDLGAADYVDSDGIRWLHRLQEALSGRDVVLRLAIREGSRAERTLCLLQLDRVFRMDRYPAEPVHPGGAAARDDGRLPSARGEGRGDRGP